MRRRLVLVATSPGLAYAAWMAWRRLASVQVIMLGDPGQLAGARRMRVTTLPADLEGRPLADALPEGEVVACDERAHVRLLDAGIRVLGHGDAALIRAIADKAQYPELGRRCGFKTPAVLESVPESGEFIQKPRWGYGGQGVARWTPGDERLPDTLVTPFIPGRDVDVSLVAVEGQVIASTAERALGPGMRQYFHDAGIEAAVARIASGLHYTGLLHVDLRLDHDGTPWVVDINPRIWASHWMAQSMGMDLAGTWLKAMTGRPYHFRHRAGIVAPPWRFAKALRWGRPSFLAPLRAFVVWWADPGVVRAMRRYAAESGHAAPAWPSAL